MQRVIERATFFIDREEAERSDTHKQIIPYVIVRNRGLVLTYRRSKVSGESRLKGMRSIGFGGHVNESDKTYYHALRREMSEELGIELQDDFKPEPLAVINDTTTSVGRVHLGIAHVLRWGAAITPSLEISDPLWLPISSIKKVPYDYENWSKLCIAEIL